MKKRDSDKKSRNQCNSNLRHLLSNPVPTQQEKNKKYMLKLIYLDLPSLSRKLRNSRWGAPHTQNAHSFGPRRAPERNRSFAAPRPEPGAGRSRNAGSVSFCTDYGGSACSDYSSEAGQRKNSTSFRGTAIKHYISGHSGYASRNRQAELRSAQSTRKGSRNHESDQKFSEYLTQTGDSGRGLLETVRAQPHAVG